MQGFVLFLFLLRTRLYSHSVIPLFGNQQLIQQSTAFLEICNKITKGIMVVNNGRISGFITEEIRNLKVKKKKKIHGYTSTEVTS